MIKVGFTGTRQGMTPKQLACFRQLLPGAEGEFHMGMCVGADVQAAEIARQEGYRIVGHPPTETRLMVKFHCHELRMAEGYLDRNRRIVEETEMLLATPKEALEALRSGTWATIRYARQLKRNILIILPDGCLRAEGTKARRY
jgi:hypothetical protein